MWPEKWSHRLRVLLTIFLVVFGRCVCFLELLEEAQEGVCNTFCRLLLHQRQPQKWGGVALEYLSLSGLDGGMGGNGRMGVSVDDWMVGGADG